MNLHSYLDHEDSKPIFSCAIPTHDWCLNTPSLVMKGSAVQMTSSVQTFTKILNLCCGLDLEHCNPVSLQDTRHEGNKNCMGEHIWHQSAFQNSHHHKEHPSPLCQHSQQKHLPSKNHYSSWQEQEKSGTDLQSNCSPVTCPSWIKRNYCSCFTMGWKALNNQTITCTIPNTIYIIMCTIHNEWYVGSTMDLRACWRNHKSDTKLKRAMKVWCGWPHDKICPSWRPQAWLFFF